MSAFAVALHMHQPLIPAGGPELGSAAVIGNLQYMLDNRGVGENHNAPVFLRCYQRMGEIVPRLVDEGRRRGSCWSTRAPCCTGCVGWERV